MSVYNNKKIVTDEYFSQEMYDSSPSSDEETPSIEKQSYKETDERVEALRKLLEGADLNNNDSKDEPSSPRTRSSTISTPGRGSLEKNVDAQKALSDIKTQLQSTLPQNKNPQTTNTPRDSTNELRNRAFSVKTPKSTVIVEEGKPGSKEKKNRPVERTFSMITGNNNNHPKDRKELSPQRSRPTPFISHDGSKRMSLTPVMLNNEKAAYKIIKTYRKQCNRNVLQDFLSSYTTLSEKETRHSSFDEMKKAKAVWLPVLLIKHFHGGKDTKFAELYDKPKNNPEYPSVQELLAIMGSVVARTELSEKYENTQPQEDMFEKLVKKIAILENITPKGSEEKDTLDSRKRLFCEGAKGKVLTYSAPVIKRLMMALLLDQVGREKQDVFLRNTSSALLLYTSFTDLFATKFLGSYPFAQIAVDYALGSKADLGNLYEKAHNNPENKELEKGYTEALDDAVIAFLTTLNSITKLQDKAEWKSLHEAFYEVLQKERTKLPKNHTSESFLLSTFLLRCLCPELTKCGQYLKDSKDPVQMRIGGTIYRIAHRLQSLIGNLDVKEEVKPGDLMLLAKLGKIFLPEKSVQDILKSLSSLQK